MPNAHWLRSGGAAASLVLIGVLVGGMAYGVSEEVPLGSVAGTVVMEGNKKPLPNAEVVLSPDFELPDKVSFRQFTKTNEKGEYSLSGLPAGVYSVAVYGKVHSNYDLKVVVKEAKISRLDAVLKMTGAELQLRVSDRVLTPGEELEYEVSGATTEKEVTISLYSVGEDALRAKGSVQEIVPSLVTNKNLKNPATLPGLKRLESKTLPLSAIDIEGVFAESMKRPGLPKGMYLMEAGYGTNRRYAWFTVTDIAVVVKSVRESLLAYVVDIKSGSPLTGVPVTAWSPGGQPTQQTTDSMGVVRMSRPRVSGSVPIVVGAKRGDSRAFAWFNAYIPPEGQDESRNPVIYLQTDRPIYRPGDTVQFRGIARVPNGQAWQLPGPGSVKITVKDTDESEAAVFTAPLNDLGSFQGEFATSKESKPGSWQIEMELGATQTSHYVDVVPFRKPEYSVTVTPAQKTYRRGATIRMKVKAEYFTGEPYAGAPVRANVSRKHLWMGSPFEDDYEEYESDYAGDFVSTVEGTTNASGEAFLEYNTALDRSEFTELDDFEYTMEAGVSDQSGRSFNGTGSAYVTRGEFDLQAEFDTYIGAVGKELRLQINASSYGDKKPVVGSQVTVDFVRIRYTQTDEVEVPVSKAQLATGQNGEAVGALTPDRGGLYRARVSTQDTRGNKISTMAYVWVDGVGVEAENWKPGLRVMLDKKEYGPKEPVTVLIQTDNPGGSALLTVEGQNVIQARVVSLKQNATTVRLPSLGAVAPGAEVRVVYIRDKKYQEDGRSVRVALTEKKLSLSVEADRKEASPGEEVTYTISAKNPDGSPAVADVALGVVDEGIYAIKEDRSDPLGAFYTFNNSMVGTFYSFPEIYLDGEDKAPANLQVRRTFVDTAFWRPSVRTGSNGTAQVKVKLPDNLTSWRATVTGVTASTALGKAKSNLVSRRELMARLSLPTFLVQDDRQEVGGLITNGTDQEMKVHVEAKWDGLNVEGEPKTTVTVPARSAKTVTWTLVGTDPVEAKVQLAAWTDEGKQDALELPLKVRVKGVPKVDYRAGSFQGDVTEELTLDDSAAEATLNVEVIASPIQALAGSLDYLIQYPYGCVEQTLSRFVPALAARSAMKGSGLIDAAMDEKITKVAAESLRRLRAMQQADGAWGWWENGPSSSLITASVLEGLRIAEVNGVTVDANMKSQALKRSEELLKMKADEGWFESKTYLAYAVLMHQDSQVAEQVIREYVAGIPKLERKPESDVLARLVLAYRLMDKRRGTASPEAERLYRELMGQAAKGSSVITWDSYGWGETSARGLQAALTMDDLPNAEMIVRGILKQRRGNAWQSTRDTGMKVLAISEYFQRVGGGSLNGSLLVTVNGVEQARQEVTPELGKPIMIRLDKSQLKAGSNLVALKSEGGVRPFYSVSLTQNSRQENIAEVSANGMNISREYFRTQSTKLEDGTVVLSASKDPVTSIKSGEIYRVVLTITATKPVGYLMIEDPIPSNCRIAAMDSPSYSEWSFWFDAVDYYDDRAVFFRMDVAPGTHIIEYAVRAEAGGKGNAMPAVASMMYQPDFRASTSLKVLEVQR